MLISGLTESFRKSYSANRGYSRWMQRFWSSSIISWKWAWRFYNLVNSKACSEATHILRYLTIKKQVYLDFCNFRSCLITTGLKHRKAPQTRVMNKIKSNQLPKCPADIISHRPTSRKNGTLRYNSIRKHDAAAYWRQTGVPSSHTKYGRSMRHQASFWHQLREATRRGYVH